MVEKRLYLDLSLNGKVKVERRIKDLLFDPRRFFDAHGENPLLDPL